MADPPRLDPDLVWLDFLRPTGLVVAPSLLKDLLLVPQLQTRTDTAVVAELLRPDDEEGPALLDPWAFMERVLDWPASRVAGAPGGPPLPEDDLCKVLPEYDTVLEPHWAMTGPDGKWQLMARIEADGVKPDARGALAGWEATPHQRFERLLRETEIPIGVLITDEQLRLVYAPRGETSGWISFPLRPLATVAGRPMLGGLKLVLNRFRLFNDAEDRRLPALLKASRDAQTNVSTMLAEQVVGALHELLRGFTVAEPDFIRKLSAESPQHLYEGLLTVLMRLVFVLYAEDRDLIPSRTDETARDFYGQGYAVRSLYGKLLEDQARYPDTMEERRGAWGRLIALFRLIHAGDRTGWIRARGGKLFDPDAFPFLEGRATTEVPPRIVGITDGCVLRILDDLLTLKGERLSYRTLDVEQIGSVYETVMGFTVLPASGPVLTIRAGKHNRTPVFVDLADLAALRPNERLKRLKEGAQRGSLTERQQRAIRAAEGVDGVAAALDGIVDERGSPDKRILQAGTPILQPTAERRSSGSHYTPRSLTEPIVRHALEPAFERLGPDARPENVLDLKVCDPAMGSGAFLVEACRAVAARLVQAWARWPETRPKPPPDEDEDLHARRLVAQRCLYGVDKNPMATDLAKLSLWLATLARDHEFTFLDHALKTGDSLVGLSRAQIAAIHWDTSKPSLPLFRELIRERFETALAARAEIRDAPDDVQRAIQETRYQQIERRLSDARLLGDAVIAAFFSADKPRTREAKRQEIESWLNETPDMMWMKVRRLAATLRQGARPIPPFHWELEFPEVFAGENTGFDAIIGNPPFAGGKIIPGLLGPNYCELIKVLTTEAIGAADLIAYFFRRAFSLLATGGCLGFLATNSLAQTVSRRVGLDPIVRAGGRIYEVWRDQPWPGEAAVIVTRIHIIKGAPSRCQLDGREVPTIPPTLVPGADISTAEKLAPSIVYSAGVVLYGDAFILNSVQASEFLARNPGLHNWLRKYVNGRILSETPSAESDLVVVDFGELPRTAIYGCDDFLKWLIPQVLTERANQTRQIHETRPWLHWDKRTIFFDLAREKCLVLVCATPATYLAFRFIEPQKFFMQDVVVFAEDRPAFFGLMQSRVHECWAHATSGTLKNDIRYSTSNSFVTFPFEDKLLDDTELALASTKYHEARSAFMAGSRLGLTATYTRFHDPRQCDPEIQQLRELHAAIDRAVLSSYEWADLAECAEPYFLDEANEDEHRYQGRLFWRAAFRDEVLTRLLALNAERAAAERAKAAATTRVRRKKLMATSTHDILEEIGGNEDC